MLGGGGGGPRVCSPWKKYKWCDLGVPKYVITNLKINNLRIINQQQQYLIANQTKWISLYSFYFLAGLPKSLKL